MGVYHFMGVGKAVGAITCAVSYIEKGLDAIQAGNANEEIKRLFQGSGGISHAEVDRGKIEAIVFFTSKEVIGGTLKAFPYKGCDKPGAVREEIVRNLRKVWKRASPHEGRKVFWCEVDIDDFQDCFDKVLKVAYRFSPHGKQGKEIWCNLTSGANSIGFALLSMARLSGLSTTHYLISQRREYQREVVVPSKIKIQPNQDGYFNVMPFLKTYIDTLQFYYILEEMDKLNKPVSTHDIFSRMKQQTQFADLSLDYFKRHYMLKLYGLGYTDYDIETDLSVVSESGHHFLNNELKELETALELEDKILPGDVDMVAESKKWPWFTVETI